MAAATGNSGSTTSRAPDPAATRSPSAAYSGSAISTLAAMPRKHGTSSGWVSGGPSGASGLPAAAAASVSAITSSPVVTSAANGPPGSAPISSSHRTADVARPSSSGQVQLPSVVRTAAPGNPRWPAMIAEYVIRAAGCSAALRADVRQALVASATGLPPRPRAINWVKHTTYLFR